MKNKLKTIVLLAIVWMIFLSFGSIASAELGGWTKETTIKEKGANKVEKLSICPKTLMKASCLTCHTTPGWKLKESKPNPTWDVPMDGEMINGKLYVYFTYVNSTPIRELYNWLQWHKDITHIVMEIQSPGGSVFEAKRIIGLMGRMKKEGYTIETHVNSFAASAGFIVFVAGSKGSRYVSPEAELMWHELITFKMFDISGPADKEDEARVLRHLQDTQNQWLAGRGNMTKAELDLAIRKKELWMNGAQAVKKGFADGFLGENK